MITPLDIDLIMGEGESPDKAGVRVLREALSHRGSVFPAVGLIGNIPILVSFPTRRPILVGRSRNCGLRIESSEVSSEHARIGFEEDAFWVEDLGSTNGTFVGEERVSGRRSLEAGEVVRMGIETNLVGITSIEQLSEIGHKQAAESLPLPTKRKYPCLIADTEIVKPQRYILAPGASVVLGRDPASDIWVGAAHVSRRHASISLADDGSVLLRDSSSNGTFLNGDRLDQGEVRELSSEQSVIGLGEGVRLFLCFEAADEKRLGLSSHEEEDELLEAFSSELQQGQDTVGTTRMEVEAEGVFKQLADRAALARAVSGSTSPEPSPIEEGDYDRELYEESEFAEGMVGESGGGLSKALLFVAGISLLFITVVLSRMFLSSGV